jgi:hypothetical protein
MFDYILIFCVVFALLLILKSVSISVYRYLFVWESILFGRRCKRCGIKQYFLSPYDARSLWAKYEIDINSTSIDMCEFHRHEKNSTY